MVKNGIILQDVFLNQVRRELIKVTVTLDSGEKLYGIVKGFDSFTVILEADEQYMIYKHAIAFISPDKFVSINNNFERKQQTQL